MKKVFKYVNRANDFIGYHCSTMCDMSDDIRDAKVYTCSNEEAVVIQSQVILHNFVYFVNNKATNPGVYKGNKISSIYAIPETVEEQL